MPRPTTTSQCFGASQIQHTELSKVVLPIKLDRCVVKRRCQKTLSMLPCTEICLPFPHCSYNHHFTKYCRRCSTQHRLPTVETYHTGKLPSPLFYLVYLLHPCVLGKLPGACSPPTASDCAQITAPTSMPNVLTPCFLRLGSSAQRHLFKLPAHLLSQTMLRLRFYWYLA